MFDLTRITRKNVRNLQPYSSARDEFNGQATIWLDANENPFETALNRYPDPVQSQLKQILSDRKKVDANSIFVGNGSDEIIDLLFRAFCEPATDKAYIFPPTYGMYEVCAAINNVEVVKLPLTKEFQLPSLEEIGRQVNTKGLLFICSPNNPTGNRFELETITEIANMFNGLVVVDEAYIDFSKGQSAIQLLNNVPNLVVIQTLSKGYGLAGLRVGVAYTSKEVVDVLNRIKPPYNVNSVSQQYACEIISDDLKVQMQIIEILQQRDWLLEQLSELPQVVTVFPTDANFILIEFNDALTTFDKLKQQGIIVRNRTNEIPNCLRISIGTAAQNQCLIRTLKSL
jgi:histidinol-phosphate aminotransferase